VYILNIIITKSDEEPEVDHLIPWQIDHQISWRPVAKNAVEALSKLVNKKYNYR